VEIKAAYGIDGMMSNGIRLVNQKRGTLQLQPESWKFDFDQNGAGIPNDSDLSPVG
jgi:hypothetical protein